jgi:hypothetical protein
MALPALNPSARAHPAHLAHLSEDSLESFVMGCLPATESATLVCHVLACGTCRDSLGDVFDFVEAFLYAASVADPNG